MRKRAQSCYEPSLVNKFDESDDDDGKEEQSVVKLEDHELYEEDFEEPDDLSDVENKVDIDIEDEFFPSPDPEEEDEEEDDEYAPDLLERILDALLEKYKDVGETYRKSLEHIDYRALQVEGIAPEGVRKMIENAIKKVRKYRTLHELLSDVKLNIKDVLKHPDRPRKPKSAYNFFLAERYAGFFEKYKDRLRALTECAKAFKAMSEITKRKYTNMADADRKRVREQLETFKRNHPDLKKVSKGYSKGLPTEKINETCHGFQAYLIERTKILGGTAATFRTVRTEWNRMSVLEKCRWVHKALKTFKLHQLKNEDLDIYFGGQGLPKRPLAAYPRFVHDMSGSIDATGPEKVKRISELWHNLSLEKKEKYYSLVRREASEWNNKCKRFLDSLSQEELLVYKRVYVGRKIPGIPKIATRALGAYNFFMKEQYPQYSDLTAQETMKKIGAAWKLLSPEDKQKYKDLEATAKIKFEENLLSLGLPVNKKSGLADRALLKRKPRRTKAEMALAKQKVTEKETPELPPPKAKRPRTESTNGNVSEPDKPAKKKKREDSQSTSVAISDSDSSNKKKKKESKSTQEPTFVQPKLPKEVTNRAVSESPKKKKKKTHNDSELTQEFVEPKVETPNNVLNISLSDSDSSKKKKKKKHETFEPLITSTQEQPASSNNDHVITTPKKKKKKAPLMEPPKPPRTVFKLFMNRRYPGEKEKAREKFGRLKASKKEKLESELQLLHDDYEEQMRKYIKSLNPIEREAYKKQIIERTTKKKHRKHDDSHTTDTDA